MDDLDLDLAELENEIEHAAYFKAVRKAVKSKHSSAERASAAMTVILPYTSEQSEAAYLWGDSQFRDTVLAFPTKLPIAEHEARLNALRLLWVRPLRFIGGVDRFIERQRSKEPADRHWFRWAQLINRVTKAHSPARRDWLAEYRARSAVKASQRASEKRYNEKHRDQRAAKMRARRAAAKASKAGAS